MQKTIFKYQLDVSDFQYIEMPKGSEILSVQVQNGMPCIWVLVDVQNQRERRIFEIFGTGNPVKCDKDIERKFIGTVQIDSGRLVWHVFERVN